MKKMIFSGLVMMLVGVLAIGATTAAFTSRATVENNTFTTASGALEIRINGSKSIPGFTVNDAQPGTCKSGKFTVNNFGAPFFNGPSTMAAKSLMISAVQDGGSADLFNALTAKIEANRGWATRMAVYNDDLSGLHNADLLAPRWTELPAGWSEDVFYEICFPANADSSLMGKSTTFDFIVDAST